MKVGTEVWQFSSCYPGPGGSDDSKLPISHVSVKAWDEVYWMSTFDKHAAAVSGPAQLAKLANIYKAQGIGFEVWCVPKGTNTAAMLALAKACLDVPGVEALTFDVEPYAGFCAGNCTGLATSLMRALREQRPGARLGVTYDPRPQHWGSSGTAEWLKYADIASPMVYHVSFAGQGVWADPSGSVRQAYDDLRSKLAPGRPIDYVPLLQGNAAADQVVRAVEAAVAIGGRPSLWRRGVVTAAAWAAVSAIAAPVPPAPPPPPPPPPAPGPPPAPPVDPCAGLNTIVADLKSELTAVTSERDSAEANLHSREAELAAARSQLDAAQGQLEEYDALKLAISVVRRAAGL